MRDHTSHDRDPAARRLRAITRLLSQSALHGPAFTYALPQLPELRGARVLDLGCGEGGASLFFALRGANVIGVDLRAGYVGLAAATARRWGVSAHCRFVAGRGEALPVATASIDLAFSRSSLQYMEHAQVVGELARVVRPGGRIVLIENLPHHPMILLYRLLKSATGRDSVARSSMGEIRSYVSIRTIESMKAEFPELEHREFELTRVALVPWIGPIRGRPALQPLARALERFDAALLALVPPLRRLAWYTAILGRRR